MTVVTGHIRRIAAQHRARFHDQIFQNLVHRRAEMDVGIGVGWAVVQDEFFGARARLTNLLIKIHIRPLLQTRRLALWQVCLLTEFSFRQIYCLLEFECWCFSGHKAVSVKTK